MHVNSQIVIKESTGIVDQVPSVGIFLPTFFRVLLIFGKLILDDGFGIWVVALGIFLVDAKIVFYSIFFCEFGGNLLTDPIVLFAGLDESLDISLLLDLAIVLVITFYWLDAFSGFFSMLDFFWIPLFRLLEWLYI